MDATLPTAPERARQLVRRFPHTRVLVVGDVMLDQFVIGRVNRISPEAPVPVVEHDRDEFRAGGAANVASNLTALGGHVELVSVVGDDTAAEQLRRELQLRAIGISGLVTDRERPTTRKLRIVTSRNQQVARIDYELDRELSEEVEALLIARLDPIVKTVGAIVVSDYLKGAVTRQLVARLVAYSRDRGVPVLVDPKIPHIDYYAGVTLITPNHHEAETAAHMRIRSEADATRAAAIIRQRARCEGVLITRGEQGMSIVHGNLSAHFPAVAREVADVTGAGDTVIATLALGLAAGGTLGEAASLANHAAGVVVGKFGPATLTPAELLESAGFGVPDAQSSAHISDGSAAGR
jgi:D-glycero-beta-D-manno-heptose-7-phosphate kinase